MTRALSLDIRDWVVLAVEGGLSRRSAAKRFGVAASTAIKWIDRWRRTGDVGPRPQGGDRRSQRIEVYSEEILALIDKKAGRGLWYSDSGSAAQTSYSLALAQRLYRARNRK